MTAAGALAGGYECKAGKKLYAYAGSWHQSGTDVTWQVRVIHEGKSTHAKGELQLTSLIADPAIAIRAAVERFIEERSQGRLVRGG